MRTETSELELSMFPNQSRLVKLPLPLTPDPPLNQPLSRRWMEEGPLFALLLARFPLSCIFPSFPSFVFDSLALLLLTSSEPICE